jgi:hypothetical protein
MTSSGSNVPIVHSATRPSASGKISARASRQIA